MFVDDKFSKCFKSYLGEDAVYNFINSMVVESKYYSDVMKKHFNKELVMTKKDVGGDVKVRNHCHVTAAHRDFNVKVKLNIKLLLYPTT